MKPDQQQGSRNWLFGFHLSPENLLIRALSESKRLFFYRCLPLCIYASGGEGHLNFGTGPYMDFIEFRWVCTLTFDEKDAYHHLT